VRDLERKLIPRLVAHSPCLAALLESDDPREALTGFKNVLELEKEPAEW
jgi:hypothetical protein